MSQSNFGEILELMECLKEFLGDYNPESSLQFYPEGRHPPNIVREQSDVSITTESSRVDNYNYGIDLLGEHSTALFYQQSDSSFPGFVGGAFDPHDEPSSITEGDLQLENEIGMGTAEAMCEQIHEAMHSTGPTHSRPWLSSGDLHVISYRNRLHAVLRQRFSEPTLTKLTDYACGTETGTHKGGETSQRIFVILVLIRKIETLPAFMKDGLRDRDLPFEWLNPASRDQLISPKSQFAKNPLPCFERKGKGLHDHKAFALKTLLQTDPDQAENEFEQELKAFTKMESGDYILDLCNLKHFWDKCPTQVQQDSRQPDVLLRWVAEQCHALAAALQSIHEVRVKALIRAKRISPDGEIDRDIYGIHGDIKPENISLFNHLDKSLGIGTLKIADFGLTEFYRLTSRTRSFNHGSDAREPALTYEAPELVQPGEVYSRKADVWALGCVFSEFLTWVVCRHWAVGDYGIARAMERDWDESKQRYRWAEDKFFVAIYNEGGVNGAVRTLLKPSVDSVSHALSVVIPARQP
ncbi:hypothetical protein CSAL01_04814 [Colletotrichum salicis]|uniref:Protein kinase domain-containing protein n=1 Tax=Colletotrichum salicis TaxID=1209931 RepID=A0A135TS11_9PEZI|nr:hypothetical protein CSAL01_04814 [Colletotrichum salicis]